jgi:ArsR family transcriptional regulator
MADIFDVVADPTRRELMAILLERYLEGADAPHGGESNVGGLVHQLGLSQPTVSKHLKVLRDAGLVTVRDQGQHRFYKLDPTPLDSIEGWLRPFLPEGAADQSPAANEAPVLPSVVAPSVPVGAQRLGAALATGMHGVRSAFSRR